MSRPAVPASMMFQLTEEFFALQELFNPEYGLFETGSEYQTVINAMSGLIDPEHHLQHFKSVFVPLVQCGIDLG